jgi:hypothetical protein
MILIFASCNQETKEVNKKVESQPAIVSSNKAHIVKELNDTVRINFKYKDASYQNLFLNSIIQTISHEGEFKPHLNKSGKIDIHQVNQKNLTIAYDSADMRFFISKEYCLEGVHIASVGFYGNRSKRHPEFKPGFGLEEWTFNSNTDRDRAFDLINYVYRHPKSIVMYEKSYPQLIKAENRILILKTGFDIWEKYVIEYRQILERLIESNYR